MKHMERFKKLTNLSIKLGWMDKDPFRDYKMKFKKFDRAYLNQRELNYIEETRFSRATLETTKDIFLFACYTGLSYVDVKQLTRDNLIKGGEWEGLDLLQTGKKPNSDEDPFTRKSSTHFSEVPESRFGIKLYIIYNQVKTKI